MDSIDKNIKNTLVEWALSELSCRQANSKPQAYAWPLNCLASINSFSSSSHKSKNIKNNLPGQLLVSIHSMVQAAVFHVFFIGF